MHINLILDSEQRSASPVPPVLILKIVVGTLVLAVVLGIVAFFMTYGALKRDAAATSEEWRRTEVKYKAALALRTDLAVRNDFYKEITGWRDTRTSWGAQLQALRASVPSAIQLTELQVSHGIFVISNKVPARIYEMRLFGRIGGARSEVVVGEFAEAFRQPPFDAAIESAVIPPGRFRQDPQAKSDRVFELVCKYKARRLE